MTIYEKTITTFAILFLIFCIFLAMQNAVTYYSAEKYRKRSMELELEVAMCGIEIGLDDED